jgi:hypothetical protein
MHFTLLFSIITQFCVVSPYAHYAKSDLAGELRRRANPIVTSGSDGSTDPVLIGDLRTRVVTKTGQDVYDILMSNQDGYSDVTGTKPANIESCLTSTDVCCPWWFVSDYLTEQFVGDDGLCNDMARAAIRLGFHDAGTWSQSLADSGSDFGGADGSFSLFGEISRPENEGLKDIDDLATFLWSPKSPFGDFDLGMADLIQYMAIHATVSCPLGPRVRTFIGRKVCSPHTLLLPCSDCRRTRFDKHQIICFQMFFPMQIHC